MSKAKKTRRKSTSGVSMHDPVVCVRLPQDLLDSIDATARECGRSRSSEMRLRLTTSLERLPVIASYADQA